MSENVTYPIPSATEMKKIADETHGNFSICFPTMLYYTKQNIIKKANLGKYETEISFKELLNECLNVHYTKRDSIFSYLTSNSNCETMVDSIKKQLQTKGYTVTIKDYSMNSTIQIKWD